MKRILTILFILSGLIAAKDVVDIKANQPGQLVIELSIDSTWISSNDQSIHTIPSLDAYFEPGFPIIPYYQEVLIGVPANADLRIFSDDRETLGDYNPTILGSEKSKGLEVEFELPIESKFNGYFPNQNVKLSPTKDVNGAPSSKIEVFPFSIQDSQLFVTKNISVQISWDAAVQGSPVKILSKTSLKELKSKKILKKPTQNIIPDYQFSSDIAKIVIDASAWYKISNSELLSNGIDLTGFNPKSIRVWNKDDEIPVYIEIGNDGAFNNEDMIVFYGEINSSPEGRDYEHNFYTNDNVYWLTWGAGEGLRFEEKDVFPDLPASEVYIPEYFTDTLKVEKEQRYFRLNYNNNYLFQNWDITDHIFMAASVAAGGIKNITFKISDPVSSIDNSVEIEVLVYGVSYNDHVLNVNLNDNELLRVEWSGQSSLSANNYNQQLFSSDILQNGNNVLSLLLHKDDPSANDRMEMNWFKLIYPRYFRATNDYLEFNSSENNSSTIQFNIQNVSSPEILLFKGKNQILLNYNISEIEQENYDVSFQDDNSNLTYELIAKDKLISVKQLTLEIPIQNQLNSIQNTYIVICPDSFKSILEPLLDIHNGVAVDVEDIYRQYNGGILSPYAIKAFLSDLYYNNNLEYVLIAHQNNLYDQCCFQSTNQRDAFIPAMHIFVYQWGDVVSDYWYSLLEGDDYLPEIAVGRFPAANSIELQEMVRKTMFHMNRNPQIWDNNALLIGGKENVFIYQSEDLANNFIDNGQFLSRIYVATDTTSNFYYSNTDTLLNHFNRGLAYVNFLGHGGAYVWSDAQLLNRDAIEQEVIRNGNRTPFVTSMTCYTGDISRPNSLGRYMLTNQYGGAHAWFGSAGPAWSINDYALAKPLQKLLLSDEDLSVGDLINQSKIDYYITNSIAYPSIAGSQLFQFNLIGDPVVKVKKPIKENVTITPLDPEPGEDIEIKSNEALSDSVFYQIFLPDNYSLNQSSVLGNSLPEILSLPDTLSKGIHKINISHKSDNLLYNSSQLLSVAGSFVNILSTIPAVPTICDSISVITEVLDRNGISSVRILNHSVPH
ncbi:C25 family cysteine peptidase [Candidatus Neomarinimicrobiota bacterium]